MMITYERMNKKRTCVYIYIWQRIYIYFTVEYIYEQHVSIYRRTEIAADSKTEHFK